MREAFSEARLIAVYREIVRPLYAYVSRQCGGDRALAEDVTQEAWLRGMRDWRERGFPDKPLAWLTSVARNLIVDQLRRGEHVPLDVIRATDGILAIENDDTRETAEVVAAVNHALARLPKAQAQLLESFHFEHSHVAMLATIHGVSERTIERRLQQAREQLRRELRLLLNPQGGIL
jgi:RNA polymerase sigma-70 factor (ECF subfamily)